MNDGRRILWFSEDKNKMQSKSNFTVLFMDTKNLAKSAQKSADN